MRTHHYAKPQRIPAEIVSRTFVLHVVPQHAPYVSRTVEVPATHSLADLHSALQDVLDLDEPPRYAFLTGQPDDEEEDAGIFAGPGKQVKNTSLHEAGLQPGMRLLYVLGSEDEDEDELVHRIRVESQGTREPDVSYPRLIRSVGAAPQLGEDEEPPELDADLLPLEEEVAAACAAYIEAQEQLEESQEPPQPLDPATLRTELSLIRRLLEAMNGRTEQAYALDARCEEAVFDWISDRLFDAAGQGLGDEALALNEDWAKLLRFDADGGPESGGWLCDPARLLLVAGRKEEARAAAEQQLSRAPKSPSALSTMTDVLQGCGDLEGATEVARRYLALARQAEDVEELAAALSTLADVLHARGQEEEAAALNRELDELLIEEGDEDEDEEGDEDDGEDEAQDESGGEEAGEDATAKGGPAAQAPAAAAPKVGRNEPCPCGSGKKYKKCCGS